MTKVLSNILDLHDYGVKHPSEYTVSELSTLIKSSIEDNVGFVRVKGEISGLKIAPSGHVYFSLKDSSAILSAVCWKGIAQSLKYRPEDGLEVICAGSVTTYAGQSKYQMMVQSINPTGVGALMALLEKRKQQFMEEGLFDEKHKKSLPFMPKIIGVVTSLGGAVIRDIIHRVNDRHHAHIIVWPVLVQGEGSALQVARAVTGFNELHDVNRPDVIIIARGGGSIEDLWSFNEEIVVRSVFNSKIPVISAVGHEVDTTLVDYVADVRAPTPTAAAELAVPVRRELLSGLQDLKHRQINGMQRYLDYYTGLVTSFTHAMPDLQSAINYYVQRLDELSIRLIEAFPRFSKNALAQLGMIAARIQSPISHISMCYNILDPKISQLQSVVLKSLESKIHGLELSVKLLDSYDYKNTLKRGFTIIRGQDGKILKLSEDVGADQNVTVEFADAVRTANID